jgi:hypothetical protein
LGQIFIGSNDLDVETVIANSKKFKSSCSDQIPAELIQTGGAILASVIHKHKIFLDEEELRDLWKESLIVPIHKESVKTNCINYYRISDNILSNILLSRLSPYIEVIMGEHRCRFLRNSSTSNQIVCIRQILEKVGVQ